MKGLGHCRHFAVLGEVMAVPIENVISHLIRWAEAKYLHKYFSKIAFQIRYPFVYEDSFYSFMDSNGSRFIEKKQVNPSFYVSIGRFRWEVTTDSVEILLTGRNMLFGVEKLKEPATG